MKYVYECLKARIPNAYYTIASEQKNSNFYIDSSHRARKVLSIILISTLKNTILVIV